jgi:hypothetical protein
MIKLTSSTCAGKVPIMGQPFEWPGIRQGDPKALGIRWTVFKVKDYMHLTDISTRNRLFCVSYLNSNHKTNGNFLISWTNISLSRRSPFRGERVRTTATHEYQTTYHKPPKQEVTTTQRYNTPVFMLYSVSGSTGNAVEFGLAGTVFFITYANTGQGHCAKYCRLPWAAHSSTGSSYV